MTSLRLGLRIAGVSVAGMLALAGCDPDDGNSETGNNGPTTTMGSTDTEDETNETTGEETEPPADSSGESGDETPSVDVTHDMDIQPIWTASCATASCHDGTFVPNLTEGMAYGEIVGVTSDTVADVNYIEANEPGMSYLYLKVTNAQADVGGAGVQMPLGGMLADEEIQLIEDWINAGAPE